tara:strand:+ start:1969 stop:3204 length:1236 start_codon:yes stop_codon:yes gene_type:complete
VINKNLFLKDNINSKNLSGVLSKNLSKKFDKILTKIKDDLKNSKHTLNVLNKNFKFNFKKQDLQKFNKFQNIALIGMGGSILGSEAIYYFLQSKIKKKINFFDDLDISKITEFKKKHSLTKTLFIIISKSGNTIETLSNTFALNIMKKNSKNIIIISEKKNNLLFNLSKKLNLFYIEHKNYIGGRYSVLSEVGMVPAYLMGLNLYKFRSQIKDYFNGANKTFLKNSSIKLTILLTKKIDNIIFLNYSPRLEKFLFWSQQLIAESLGKKNKGFLPVISNVPKDHHSLLQLYLDGPRNKIFNIFSFDEKFKETFRTNKDLKFNSFLDKKKLSSIKNAQKQALIKSFIQKRIPFREFKIKKANEEVLGKLFSYFILETVVISNLLNINPYDQPAVEEVKIFTKKYLLKKSKYNF